MDRSGGRIGDDSVPLEDYWQECSRFEDPSQADDEEDLSKTPDEGEVEEEWLREAGFHKLVDSDPSDPSQDDLVSDLLSTLTPRQVAVVRRRLDTVHASRKKGGRVPRSGRHRADVRDLFTKDSAFSPSESLTSLHSEPASLDSSGLSCSAPSGDRWTRLPYTSAPRPTNGGPEQPFSSISQKGRALPLPPFLLRTIHSGGFSLRESTGAIDCESPTSVEVLRYETRKSVNQEREVSFLDPADETPASDASLSLEAGFQEISKRLDSGSKPQELVAFHRQSNVQVGDLSEQDRTLVRSLAVIEVAALLDSQGLVPARRKKPNRRKGKESVVFGASLRSLLELDRKRCPGLKIPLVFQWLLHHLHSDGLGEEGLLRLAGSAQKIQALKAEIERQYTSSPDVCEDLIRQTSPIDASVLLKQLVRHLPEPLLTTSHMDAFLQVPNIPSAWDQMTALNLLVLALPDPNRELLQELLYFLEKVVDNESSNRMSLGNVAMIMAPNLFPPPKKSHAHKGMDLAAEVTVAAMSSKVTELLIKHGNLLGTVPAELLAQARLQNRNNKNAKRAGRKNKTDKQKTSKDENLTSTTSIRVQVPCQRNTGVLVVPLTERTTAGEVVRGVAEALDPHQMALQENRAFQRPRTTSEPAVTRLGCLMSGKKSEFLKDHFLYLVRDDNLGDRRLDHSTLILNVISGRFAANAAWEVRCHR